MLKWNPRRELLPMFARSLWEIDVLIEVKSGKSIMKGVKRSAGTLSATRTWWPITRAHWTRMLRKDAREFLQSWKVTLMSSGTIGFPHFSSDLELSKLQKRSKMINFSSSTTSAWSIPWTYQKIAYFKEKNQLRWSKWSRNQLGQEGEIKPQSIKELYKSMITRKFKVLKRRYLKSTITTSKNKKISW